MNFKRIAVTVGLYIVMAVPLFMVTLYFIDIEVDQVYASIFDDSYMIAAQEGLSDISPASGE